MPSAGIDKHCNMNEHLCCKRHREESRHHCAHEAQSGAEQAFQACWKSSVEDDAILKHVQAGYQPDGKAFSVGYISVVGHYWGLELVGLASPYYILPRSDIQTDQSVRPYSPSLLVKCSF